MDARPVFTSTGPSAPSHGLTPQITLWHWKTHCNPPTSLRTRFIWHRQTHPWGTLPKQNRTDPNGPDDKLLSVFTPQGTLSERKRQTHPDDGEHSEEHGGDAGGDEADLPGAQRAGAAVPRTHAAVLAVLLRARPVPAHCKHTTITWRRDPGNGKDQGQSVTTVTDV